MNERNACGYDLKAQYDIGKAYSVMTSRTGEAGEKYPNRVFLILDFEKCPNPGFGICNDCDRKACTE